MSKKLRIQLYLLDNVIWVIIAVFFILNSIFTPHFSSYANIVNIFYHSAIMSMLVLGQGLVIMVGKMDLSLESTLVFAPGVVILTATKLLKTSVHPLLLIFFTIVVAGLVGYVNGIFISKIKVISFLQTLAMMIILRGLALFLLPFSIFPLSKIIGSAYTYPGGARVFFNIPMAVFITIAIFLIFHLILKYLPYGRRILATGGNVQASFISGINTSNITISAFVLAGILSGVAGVLAAGRQDAVSNTMGEGMVLLSFAGAILGGASLEGGKGTASGMFGL